jgi:hypothetical protein
MAAENPLLEETKKGQVLLIFSSTQGRVVTMLIFSAAREI